MSKLTRSVLVDIELRLKIAGVQSPIFDSESLVAFSLGIERNRIGLVKDIEDVNGDYNQGINTLPIAIGISRAAKIALGLTIIAFILSALYCNTYFMQNKLYFAVFYSFATVLAPLLYFIVKIFSAKSQKEFHHLSNILKLILFFGILSILVIALNIKYNA